jgi:hypothetical protein
MYVHHIDKVLRAALNPTHGGLAKYKLFISFITRKHFSFFFFFFLPFCLTILLTSDKFYKSWNFGCHPQLPAQHLHHLCLQGKAA